MPSDPLPPYRQIRALYDADTITVYQAYPLAIAVPALATQRLSASPSFSHTRMTWIKPSWAWMMYRSGYSFKDAGQERVLALRMKHEHFRALLAQAAVCRSGVALGEEERGEAVRVQWDPERGVRGEALGWRSIQVGISGGLGRVWAEEWVVGIEDVTGRARALREVLEREPGVEVGELVGRGLVPVERVYDVDEELRGLLLMDG